MADELKLMICELRTSALGIVTSTFLMVLILKTIDQHHVEILLTLALVMGGYALADALHTSGPIAVVVSGLLIGNHGRTS